MWLNQASSVSKDGSFRSASGIKHHNTDLSNLAKSLHNIPESSLNASYTLNSDHEISPVRQHNTSSSSISHGKGLSLSSRIRRGLMKKVIITAMKKSEHQRSTEHNNGDEVKHLSHDHHNENVSTRKELKSKNHFNKSFPAATPLKQGSTTTTKNNYLHDEEDLASLDYNSDNKESSLSGDDDNGIDIFLTLTMPTEITMENESTTTISLSEIYSSSKKCLLPTSFSATIQSTIHDLLEGSGILDIISPDKQNILYDDVESARYRITYEDHNRNDILITERNAGRYFDRCLHGEESPHLFIHFALDVIVAPDVNI